MQIQEHLGNSEISIYMFREIYDVRCSSDGLQALLMLIRGPCSLG